MRGALNRDNTVLILVQHVRGLCPCAMNARFFDPRPMFWVAWEVEVVTLAEISKGA